jgi:hypothetical protein
MTTRVLTLLIAGICLVAAGCGESGAVKVYPVKGKVMFKGKPLVGGGSIALVPLTNQPGKTAGGRIADDGTFTLTTYKEGDGSMTGEFRVNVFQEVFKEGKNSGDGQPASRAQADVPPADRIPEICQDPKNSPLKLEVKAAPQEAVVIDIPTQ